MINYRNSVIIKLKGIIEIIIILIISSCAPVESSTNTNEHKKTSIVSNKTWAPTPMKEIKEISPRLSNENYKAEIEYIKKNMRYPVEAIKRGIEGRVLVKFHVEIDGRLTDIHIVKSPDSLLSKEALRIVKSMPKWIPGQIGDKIVKCSCILPVVFKIESYKKTTNETKTNNFFQL